MYNTVTQILVSTLNPSGSHPLTLSLGYVRQARPGSISRACTHTHMCKSHSKGCIYICTADPLIRSALSSAAISLQSSFSRHLFIPLFLSISPEMVVSQQNRCCNTAPGTCLACCTVPLVLTNWSMCITEHHRFSSIHCSQLAYRRRDTVWADQASLAFPKTCLIRHGL